MNEKQRMLKYILTHLGDNFAGSWYCSYDEHMHSQIVKLQPIV